MISILAEDRPDDLLEAYMDAQARGPQWRDRIEASLACLPPAADTLRKLG